MSLIGKDFTYVPLHKRYAVCSVFYFLTAPNAIQTVNLKPRSYTAILFHSKCCISDGQSTHLVSQSLEFTGRARIQVHELVSVHEQGCLFALVLLLKGGETAPLHLQNTGQVADVALKGQKTSPDFPESVDRRNTSRSKRSRRDQLLNEAT